ncbi:MAG: AMP-binding protein [Eubacterium sp.]|nr:AMP-binding protein [Eubacterium sp.]
MSEINTKKEYKLSPVPGIAGKFISTYEDSKGLLKAIDIHDDDKFNFAYDVVDALAEKCPNKTAMLHVSKEGKERRVTFRDMMKYSNMTANYLHYLGIKKGDRVLLILKRHYQFWFTLVALHKIGAIAVPCSFLLTKKDFEYRLTAGSINAVICTADGDVADEVVKATKNYTGLKAKITVNGAKEGWSNYNRDIRFFSPDFKKPSNVACGDDPALMFFTSGTTSYPKMALHTHKYPLGHYVTARYWHQVDPDGMHFTISDTGWGKALWGKIYGQWLCEAPIFTYDYDEFFAKEILSMMEKYKMTSFCAPPTVFRMLVHVDMRKFDLSSLKNVSTAGEALNPEVYEKFYRATGLKIMEGFGQTETTLTVANLKGMEPRPGSMGKVSPLYDVKILVEGGREAGVNETGEICVDIHESKPCGLYKGYYLDKEKTDAVMHDGFYHTGDTAFKDKDGYLWYVGRADDVIKSAGYRVGPFEIENEIMKLPYVLECAVTSVPDRVRGQAIKASIVLTKGYTATDKLRKDTMKYLKSNLASYKRPKYIDFVGELPKTSSGKVRRAEIKKKDWEDK